MRKFEFKKTYEEVEVAGKVYKVDFSDDKLKEYRETFKGFQKDYSELLAMDESKMSEEQALDHFEQIQDLVKKVVEIILGPNTFDHLYEASGKSMMNVFDFIKYLGELIQEKSSRNVVDKSAQYLRNKKKK